MKMMTLLGGMLLLVLLLPIDAMAFDFGGLRINGFVSQGYLKSKDNNWLAVDSVDGTTQLNEVGLTFNMPIDDKLRVGLQLLSRDLGEEGNNDVRLDWAFGDYRFCDQFGIRAGKVKMPIGLYNEGRDSDFLRPMAFLPQSIYDETRRNLLVASQGGQIYGNLTLGALGDLDYAGHYGQINFPSDSPTLQAFLGMANSMGNDWTHISANNEYVYGASVKYNTFIDGLRLGGSWFEGKADFPLTGGSTSADGNLRVKIRQMYVASLEYATPYFTFASEYTQYKQPAWINGMQVAPIDPQSVSAGIYALLTVPMPGQENLSFSGLYDLFYRDRADKSGNAQSLATGMPAYAFYRKDVGVAARLDISGNWLVKAEWHRVSGTDLLTDFFNGAAGTASKRWEYYIVKTSFNF